MKISAAIQSTFNEIKADVRTNDITQTLAIAPKATGYGAGVNGGELLMMALATCYCNDIYREAKKMNIVVNGVLLSVQLISVKREKRAQTSNTP